MSKIALIAAVDQNYGLGFNNQLLCHLPADLKHFKDTTMGQPIIMGSKTYQSIGKPLPGRKNIVLSSSTVSHTNPNLYMASSLDQALRLAEPATEIFIIGGASIYQQCLPIADIIYLTLIHHCFVADVFFPKIDDSIWHCSYMRFCKSDEKNAYAMTFYQFDRN